MVELAHGAVSRGSASRLAHAWLAASIIASLGAVVVAALCGPVHGRSPGQALVLLLFAGSSMHVASTAWLPALRDVRACARAHTMRFVVVPLLLVLGGAAVAMALSGSGLSVLLEGFFAWQFFHFTKQNVGVAVLAATSSGVGGLRSSERRSIVVAGCFGIAALLARPQLLQLEVPASSRTVFVIATVGFLATVAVGCRIVLRRHRASRPWTFLAGYISALCFSAPIFIFTSPYAAVGGMTIAHGLQYLILVGLVAGGPVSGPRRLIRLAILANVAIAGGLVLNALSDFHHRSDATRALFGVFLGLSAAHFVVDAGLWRLRDPSARRFVEGALPDLVAPRRVAQLAADRS